MNMNAQGKPWMKPVWWQTAYPWHWEMPRAHEGELEVGNPAPPANNGNTGNIHHWRLVDRILQEFRRRNYRDIRVDQAQVVNGVIVGNNKPDIQAIDSKGKRVVVEVDTDSYSRQMHEKQVTAANPAGRAIFILIHPVTGHVLRRFAYDPRTRRVTVRRGPLPIRGGRILLGEIQLAEILDELEDLSSS